MEQGEISFDLFWAAGRYFTGDNAQENVAEMWLKSQLCTIKGRLWQPCGTHMHGCGMDMSSEVWNTCLPRLPIQLDHGVRIIIHSPRVEHSLCITMEQYLWITITWSTESYF